MKETEELSKQIAAMRLELNNLHTLADAINKRIHKIDYAYPEDLTKMYGFSGDYMYYIGVGSGRIYRKPIDNDIVVLIARFDHLEYKDIRRINNYFMTGAKKL